MSFDEKKYQRDTALLCLSLLLFCMAALCIVQYIRMS